MLKTIRIINNHRVVSATVFSVIGQFIFATFLSWAIVAYVIESATMELRSSEFSIANAFDKYSIYLLIIPLVYFIMSFIVYFICVKIFIRTKSELIKYIKYTFFAQIILSFLLGLYTSKDMQIIGGQVAFVVVENIVVFISIFLIGLKLISKKAV